MPRDKKAPKNATAEGLVVTAQQSRFHVDASNIPATKEIDIKDLSISIGGREILAHAELTLRENVHYVLVGRNGVGKSTALRALAEGRIPGVSWGLRILLLGQTKIVTASLEDHLGGVHLASATESVLEHVIRSDAARERALREVKDLSRAIDDTNDPLAVVKAVRKLRLQRLERRLAEAREIAARRSGARGAQSRKDLIVAEEKVAAASVLLKQLDDEIDATVVQDETSAAVDMVAELQSYLQTTNSSTAEPRARSVLLGLGFKQEAIDQPFTNLSGGWRTRCDLACALFQKVDILLLDECTNFLDLPAVVWLQAYIQRLEATTVVVITHDRDFADAVAEELLVLRELGLEHFRGTLSAFERERRQKTRHFTRMRDAQARKTQHMEDSIGANLRAARRSGDDKKLKQAAARRKKLDERTGLEVSATGGRFKLNRDLPGYHTARRADIDGMIPGVDPLVRMAVPAQPPGLRFPGALVSMKDVSFAYPRTTKMVLKDISLVVHPGERVGVAGLNGSGKSTLVGLMVGGGDVTGADGGGIGLQPTKGSVTRHSRARIRCFSQHAVEELEARGARDPELTALRELMQVADGELLEQDARATLGSLGLPGRIASDVPVAALSGGQKVRLALAKLIYHPPHLLVLDEVTTHLDSDTVLALIEALRDFQGALIVITHDRFFMRCIVEGDTSDLDLDSDDDEEDADADENTREWRAKPGVVHRLFRGELKVLEGGMREYETIASKSSSKRKVT
ncbi:ABC transporter ATP-binding protein uup-1 [Athelia psychrophila]|uniref:ABC transporter ATP-binding protein uup-1 n=1 Tax=Athelia psychrophila TaxID=1759441 RepID=A0A165ZE25_9AGAM|nr:ABC transporter ATP-binding protein uup-1 [Fibularhizoctonia sp. CBS 109695]